MFSLISESLTKRGEGLLNSPYCGKTFLWDRKNKPNTAKRSRKKEKKKKPKKQKLGVFVSEL